MPTNKNSNAGEDNVKKRLFKTFQHVSSPQKGNISNQATTSAPSFSGSAKANKAKQVLVTARNNTQTFINKMFQGILDTVITFFKWVFKITFWILLIAAVGEVLGGHNSSSAYETRVLQSEKGTDEQIAVVRMRGTIVEKSNDFGNAISAEDYIDLMNYLRTREEVKGVLLAIDSPGGEVYASDRLYRAIKNLSDNKPVYVYGGSTLASGAYYIAMGAKKVYVNDLTTVGSIGVVVEMLNYDGMLEKLGIKIRRMTNTGGRFKTGEGLFDDNPNGEEDKLMQRLIDVAYERFVSIVAKSRQLPMERVRSVADGRVMPAVDAKEYGLVDKITTLTGTLKDLKEILGKDKINVVEYNIKGGHIPFFSALEGAYFLITRKTELSGFRLLYMFK